MRVSVKEYPLTKKLTVKQKLWLDEYLKSNDYTIASRNAGYNGSNSSLKQIGYENATRLALFIQKRRAEIDERIDNKNIAELEDIYEFWTTTFNNPGEETKDRLKASELLAKSKGAFVEKVEVKKAKSEWFK